MAEDEAQSTQLTINGSENVPDAGKADSLSAAEEAEQRRQARLFKAGNAGGPGRPRKNKRRKAPLNVPCPPVLARRGMRPAWLQLCDEAANSGQAALNKLWEMAERYATEEEDAAGAGSKRDARYDGLPDVVADLCAELDLGIAETVHRFELGFCCEDIEVVIAQAAIATRDHTTARSAAASKWARVIVREIEALQGRKGLADGQETTDQDHAGQQAGGSGQGDERRDGDARPDGRSLHRVTERDAAGRIVTTARSDGGADGPARGRDVATFDPPGA